VKDMRKGIIVGKTEGDEKCRIEVFGKPERRKNVEEM
jgi:hypothetical protein